MKKILLILLLFVLITSPLCAGGNRWNSKPPLGSTIDWSHPLARGLVGCWLMNEGGGQVLKDLACSNDGSGGGIAWKPGGTNYNGSSFYKDISSIRNIPNGNSPITIFTILKPTSTTTALKIISRWDDGSGGYTWLLDQGASPGNLRWIVAGNNGQGMYTANSSFTYSVGQILTVIVSSLGSNNNQYIIVNKIKTNSSIQLNSSSFNATPLMTFGAGRSDASRNSYYSGDIYLAYIWNRALSSSEIQSLYQDPYQFIKPPTLWSNFKAGISEAIPFFQPIINNF